MQKSKLSLHSWFVGKWRANLRPPMCIASRVSKLLL